MSTCQCSTWLCARCACWSLARRDSGELSLHARKALCEHQWVKQVRCVELVLGQFALKSLQLLVEGESWLRFWRRCSCWSRGAQVVVECLYRCLGLTDPLLESHLGASKKFDHSCDGRSRCVVLLLY